MLSLLAIIMILSFIKIRKQDIHRSFKKEEK